MSSSCYSWYFFLGFPLTLPIFAHLQTQKPFFYRLPNLKNMKSVKSKVIALFSLCLLAVPVVASANWWNNNDCNDVPLDGGLSLLAAAGVGYGAKKIAEKRKKNQELKQK
jgi:hypothetical protein